MMMVIGVSKAILFTVYSFGHVNWIYRLGGKAFIDIKTMFMLGCMAGQWTMTVVDAEIITGSS